MKALRTITRWTATVITTVAVLAAVGVGVLGWAGYRPQPVLSGSMEPLLPVGSVVVTERVPASTVRVGDVITFQRPGTRDMLTHRVVRIDRSQGYPIYTTKGDANKTEDPFPVRLPGEVGRHATTVPHVGTAFLWLSSAPVRGGLVGLVTLLLIVSVVRAIWKPSRPVVASRVA